MRLVIQYDTDGVYVCRESDRLHKAMETERTLSGLTRVPLAELDEDCRIDVGQYVVVKIEE